MTLSATISLGELLLAGWLISKGTLSAQHRDTDYMDADFMVITP